MQTVSFWRQYLRLRPAMSDAHILIVASNFLGLY